MTIFGVILIFHYSLPENEVREYKPKETVTKHGDRYHLEPERGFGTILPDDVAEKIIAHQEKMAHEHAEYLGQKRKHLVAYLLLTVVGTFVWAYAGYFNLLYRGPCA